MCEIKIIATNKLGVRSCQVLTQLVRGLTALLSPVAKLGHPYEQEGSKSVPTMGIWKARHFPHHSSISSPMSNDTIQKLMLQHLTTSCSLLFVHLTAPMARKLPLVPRLNALMAICIHLSSCQHCFKFNTGYL